ncbi:hypothetical protein OROMI_022470 [Orobanche minor]
MRGGLALSFHLSALILIVCGHESCFILLGYSKSYTLAVRRADELLPYTSPTASPQPFLPLLAPSPLTPFTNSTIPRLSDDTVC